MKLLLTAFFLLVTVFVSAQEQIVKLSTSEFDESNKIRISNRSGWVFAPLKGLKLSDTSINTNAVEWKSIAPEYITSAIADENRDIEGWFRFRMIVDTSFEGIPTFIYFSSYGQAVDMYIDDELVRSFGNTGRYGGVYQQNAGKNSPVFFPFQFQPGKEYLLAFHYIHKSTGFPLNLFESRRDLKFTLEIAGPAGEKIFNELLRNSQTSIVFNTTVCGVLTLLFFLIFIQNRSEKILRLILFTSIIFSLVCFFNAIYFIHFYMSYSEALLFQLGISITAAMIPLCILLIIANVFTQKRPAFLWLHIFMTITLMYCFHFTGSIFLILSIVLIFLGLSLYYIIQGWKRVKGAQWAIVTGFMVTFSAMLIVFALEAIWGIPQSLFFVNILLLSFPVSLLFYVSIRFKEIIGEVKQQADKVLALTEEKRLQAVNQQLFLEEKIQERTIELTRSMEQLKSTQAQLIQSEKMASLGELIAGIAHEIQNPLNFVNNFSEVNTELIKELKDEVIKGNLNEVTSIANDIESNSEKIIHHGKRADAIVKGMLQHSRTSIGQKEPTDINALCDEYLRLAYHGIKAKDNSFNALFETHFDEKLGEVNVIPQDIGRVLLNLINNAFYAVAEKSKTADANYQPMVTVRTARENGKVVIRVVDNGNGIPENMKDKIFQPFFTTKPTGQGTGLGLSLSYDIVKAHGGDLKVESTEGQGTTFIILIPIL